MADLITELTPEQKELQEQYLKDYMAIGWSTEPSDREMAEQAILDLYKLKGAKAPEFVWFDSPFAAVETLIESGVTASLSGTDGQLDAYWIAYY
jgi:hypothetical protein